VCVSGSPLSDPDRSLWRRDLIAEGVAVLQAALACDRLGEYQVQAAIAALHADAQTADGTDWVQIVEWYDELVRLTDSPVVRLNRAVAVGEADGPQAGLAALAELDPMLPRYTASAAYLHERAGDVATAAQLYVEAAAQAQSLAEHNHLTPRAAILAIASRARVAERRLGAFSTLTWQPGPGRCKPGNAAHTPHPGQIAPVSRPNARRC
jgi:predicted RNA polymerase sigma factor